MIKLWRQAAVVLAPVVGLGLSGCFFDKNDDGGGHGPHDGGGGFFPGDGGSGSYMPGGPGFPGGGGTVVQGSEDVSLTFNLNGAASLVTSDSSVSNAALRGDDRVLAKSGADQGQSSGSDDDDSDTSTNLLAVDANGVISQALVSNTPVKVRYTVLEPLGEYVYVVLDTGWDGNSDGQDYSQFIAKINCGILRISRTTNAFECVMPGALVQKMDDSYRQNISGNQKPVQFDPNGNIYFAASTFERREDVWHDCCDEFGNQVERYNYWLDQYDWRARVYRVDRDTLESTALTQDNVNVSFFIALSTGEIVYQSMTDMGEQTLNLWQDGATIQLTDQNWGVEFFTSDSQNAVIWGTWSHSAPGMFIARPRGEGLSGVERTKLNTELFGSGRDGQKPVPRRVIAGDDGRLYGVFESWQWDPETQLNSTVMTVYQVLPFDPIPKVQFTLSDNYGWWDWMGNTTFQVSQGHLYYTESENVPFLGNRDVIKVVNLSDRSVTRLLGSSDSERYAIYNWQLGGRYLYFSAQDLATTTVTTGRVDTVKFANGDSDYLLVVPSSSAASAIDAIRDIEILDSAAVDANASTDPAAAPSITYHTDLENVYSVSLDFSAAVTPTVVGPLVSLVGDPDGDADAVAFMPVWIANTLHMIPDLSDTAAVALGDATGQGLAYGSTYEVSFTSPINDVFGNVLDNQTSGASHRFDTRPTSGWYATAATASSSDLSSGDAARYAGASGKTNEWDYKKEIFELAASSVTEHVQLEFSAKNLGGSGVHVLFWNETNYSNNNSDTWNAQEVSMRIGDWGWSNMEYRTNNGGNQWSDGQTNQAFNGHWARYRIKIFGTEVQVSMSEDGTESGFEAITALTVDNEDMRSRTGDTMRLFIGVSEPMLMDDIVVSELDSDGAVVSELDNQDFDGLNASGIGTYFGSDIGNQTLGWW